MKKNYNDVNSFKETSSYKNEPLEVVLFYYISELSNFPDNRNLIKKICQTDKSLEKDDVIQIAYIKMLGLLEKNDDFLKLSRFSYRFILLDIHTEKSRKNQDVESLDNFQEIKDDYYSNTESIIYYNSLTSILNDREKQICDMYFLHKMGFTEIGSELNVSKQRVFISLNNVFKKIRSSFDN